MTPGPDLGDYEKAEQAFRTAAVFRPDLPVGPLGLSALALYRGDFEFARKQCDDTRKKYENSPQPLMMAAVIEFFSRDFDAAERLYREAASRLGRTGGLDFLGSVRFLSAIGFIRLKAGAEAEGKALLEEAQALDEKELSSTNDDQRRSYSLAADNAALGNHQAAVAALSDAIAAGWIDYRSIELDPRFDLIRDTEVFKEIGKHLTQKVENMRRHLPSRKLALTPNSQ